MKKTTESAINELQFYPTIIDAIGNTPLVRLNRIAEDVPPLVLVKVEMMNPGGSVKDRIAYAMVEYCERQGLLKPGGTIVEPTSGNTGHGLAIVAATRGYRCIFTMTDKVSEEKRNLLRAYGAQLVICPAEAAPDSPDFYRNVARRLAEGIPGACSPNQYSHPANADAHYHTTGPEIWRDTAGRVTTFVASIGTGGTISGTGRYLKEVNPRIKIIGADPVGSVYSGDTAESYLVEGIGWVWGKDTFPKNYNPAIVDEYVRIDDQASFCWAQRLAREEGILVGGSAGTALGAGLTYAKQLSPDDVVVILLPDTGRAYLSKQYNEIWLRDNSLSAETRNNQPTLQDILTYRRTHAETIPLVISVRPNDSASDALDLLRRYDISQLPVVEDGRMIGSLTEELLLRQSANGEPLETRTAGEIRGNVIPMLDMSTPTEDVYPLLNDYVAAVAVIQGNNLEGIITKDDLLAFLTLSISS